MKFPLLYEDQIGPRPTKSGAVGLTEAKLFFQDPDQHKIFNDIVFKHGADKTVLWEEVT